MDGSRSHVKRVTVTESVIAWMRMCTTSSGSGTGAMLSVPSDELMKLLLSLDLDRSRGEEISSELSTALSSLPRSLLYCLCLMRLVTRRW
jgi:hypothetical protein